MITTDVDDVSGTILNDAVRTYHARLRHALDGLALDAVEVVTREILATYDRGGQIFVFGNGGSAATASHMACDLGKNTVTPGLPRLRIWSLTDNTALLTALANDLGYDAVFAEQLLQAPVWADDLVIAISGSGNSPNVLAGVATAAQAVTAHRVSDAHRVSAGLRLVTALGGYCTDDGALAVRTGDACTPRFTPGAASRRHSQR